jgi:ABC-type multidrug transport system ATPase subunit
MVIATESLTYRAYSREILRDVTIAIPQGAFAIVVGENGAGKTTLLRLLMGLSRPTRGRALVAGREPHLDPWRERARIAYIAERTSPPIDWSVDEYLEFNRRFYPQYSTAVEASLVKDFRLDRTARIGQLSTGETRRAQVVAGIAASPEILLVDEITAVLDIVGRHKFMASLQDLRSRSRATVLMATNILDDVDEYATDVVLLHQGKLTIQATKDELAARGKSLTTVLASLIEEAEAAR